MREKNKQSYRSKTSFSLYLHSMSLKGDNFGPVPLLIKMKVGNAGLIKLPFGFLKLVGFTLPEPILYLFTHL